MEDKALRKGKTSVRQDLPDNEMVSGKLEEALPGRNTNIGSRFDP